MIADSVKYKGFSCFKDGWAGFDEFKPLTVIIGRNNAGKSQLLDMVEMMTRSAVHGTQYSALCEGVLDEQFLQASFPPGTSGGGLRGDHWASHGSQLVDIPIRWEYQHDEKKCSIRNLDSFDYSIPTVKKARIHQITRHLQSVTSPISNKVFCRILADRDIGLEKASTKLGLSPNGLGATNTIRRYITSSSQPEDLIQVALRKSLSEIFGGDGDFKRIEIRQHDETDDQGTGKQGTDKQDDGGLWEVFLGEPKKGLVPLSRSGSGLKTVILVLLNLLVIPKIENKPRADFVFAFEELENNLHPALLRRLFQFLADYVEREKCMLFLSTHSSVALDFFGPRGDTQIIHVTHDGKSASTKTIAAHFEHVGLINELGAKPSDLLQANGIIWLEGPSDRIYINRFIELFSDETLYEGRDYQCAYYGGSILARSEFAPPEQSNDELVNLLRINNNVAVICDGDRTVASGTGSEIKKRVRRIEGEVEKIDGAFLWITDAKEIENYIPGGVWATVYRHDRPVPDPDKYDKFPTREIGDDAFVLKNLKRRSFDKCEFAGDAVPHLTRKVLEDRFELRSKMEELITQIKKWNE